MKKVLFCLISVLTFLCIGTKADAQNWFVGGGVNIFAMDKYANFGVDTHGGYEFNDHWAVGGFLGYQHDDDEDIATLELFGRYTPWHNDVIYIDLKAKFESSFGTTETLGGALVPSLRFRVAPRWEVYADIGHLGFRYYSANDFSTPLFSLTDREASLGVTFRF